MRCRTEPVLSLLLAVLLLAACSAPAPQHSPTEPSSSPATLPAPVKVSSPTPTAIASTASPSPAPKPATLRVVYYGADGLMLWTEGRGSRRLADVSSSGQPRITHDGQVVASLERNTLGMDEIFAVNADGTHRRWLVDQEYLQDFQPAGQIVSYDFAPHSHTLYFVTDRYDLHRVDADGGSPGLVLGSGQGGFFSFSPDGRWMVLYHPNELVLARPDGSQTRVAFQYPPDFAYTMLGPEIVWEPDSSGFYMASASGPQGDPDSMTVWFISVAGDPVVHMSYAGPYGANLSPDGRQVVYLYFQHEPVDVHVVASDGTDTTFDSYSAEVYPAIDFMGWAPDSEHFLLDLSQDGRISVPYLCAAGEQPVALTDTDDAFPIVWVDGERILFVEHGPPAGDNLRLQRLGEPSVLLDTVSSSEFDYTYSNP